jgi:pimeloyl-ACP methyl ester carboxylesterase
MKRSQFIAILASLLIVAACAQTGMPSPTVAPTLTVQAVTSTSISPTTRPTPLVTRVPQREATFKLEACTFGSVWAKCGTYRVYEDRSARAGRQIELRIAVLPAKSDQVEPDPFFYFTGGPGGSAVDTAAGIGSAFAELNEHRDLVFIDQRGTGGSNQLLCPEPEASFDINDAAALSAYAQACLEGLEADPRWYTTRAYVDDVDEVRRALGYDQINISGGSYGGTVVQVYVQHHPDTVRTATIMNSTLIDYPIFEHIADSSQRALDLVLARCADNDQCHAAFPDLKSDFNTAFEQLRQAPVVVASQSITVTPAIFAVVVHEMLMGANTSAQLPRMVHRAAALKDWEPVANVYANILANQGVTARLIMGAVIRCTEPWAINRPDEVARNGTGSYLLDNQLDSAKSLAKTCPFIPQPAADAMYGPVQKVDRPVLVLNAEEDPQNPPDNVAKTANVYPNSKVLFEPYRGHYTVNWVCLAKVVTEFVEVGNVADLKAECLNKVRPYTFDTRP